MQRYIAKNWGYKILNEQSFTFYHVLLSETGIKKLLEQVPGISEVILQEDNSIVIQTQSLAATLRNIIEYFENVENTHLETEPAYFSLPVSVANKLHQWREVYGCVLALLICQQFNMLEWGIANADVKTLYVENFTIALYDNYAKVIHPISIKNFVKRQEIEHFIAKMTDQIGKYCRNKKNNDVGNALITFASKKLGISGQAVSGLIQYKLENKNDNFFAQTV